MDRSLVRWLAVGFGIMGIVFAVQFWPKRSAPAHQGGTAPTANATKTGAETVVAKQVISPERAGNSIWYAVDRALFRLDLTPKASPTVIGTLELLPRTIRWRADGQRLLALVESEPAHWIALNLQTNQSTVLKTVVLNPTLATTRDRIIYSYSDETQTNVSVADFDGANWLAVTNLDPFINRWWWPGDGTMAIGATDYTDPPQYVRLLMGAKRLEPLAPSYGVDLRLKLSPNESQALIDTGTADAPTISVAPISGGALTTPTADTSVRLSAWLDDHSVVSISLDGTVTAFDFTKRTQTKLGQWPTTTFPIDELVAVTAKDYYAVIGGNLQRIPRP